MTTWTKVFLSVGAFLATVATVYWFLSYEDAGTVLLLGSAIMAVTVGGYLFLTGRGVERAPADREDVQARDLAGTSVGSFPFGSIWPLVLSVGLLSVGIGLIYSLILLPVGLVTSAVAVIGLVRESWS